MMMGSYRAVGVGLELLRVLGQHHYQRIQNVLARVILVLLNRLEDVVRVGDPGEIGGVLGRDGAQRHGIFGTFGAVFMQQAPIRICI